MFEKTKVVIRPVIETVSSDLEHNLKMSSKTDYTFDRMKF